MSPSSAKEGAQAVSKKLLANDRQSFTERSGSLSITVLAGKID